MASDETSKVELKNRKELEAGVIYLSYIPPYMTVKHIRRYFTDFGQIGRIYLQPGKKTSKVKKYTEGWIEFLNKKVGKRTATMLNGNIVGGRRNAPYSQCLWSIKYLHKFKWSNLTEKLAYERATRHQRMRTEISQAKQEKDWYGKMTRLKKRN